MTFKHIASFTFALALFGAAPARAELRHVEIKTLGMDWEICAHAVRVAMQKVDGIQAVRVSLKDGLTILDLKPGNSVTVAKLRQIIKNNGFVSKEATIVASGHADGSDAFVVAGTNERVTVSSPAQSAGGEWRLAVPAPRP